MSRLMSLPLGIQLAAAALVVAVPRYVIAFLAADNLRFPAPVEGMLLGISAIATAVIVAGGGAYVAHVVASAHEQRIKRGLLLMLWLVLLGCEVVLLAPPVIASLRRVELAHVLAAPAFDALWSIVMIATPALCAAACVLAASLGAHQATHTTRASAPAVAPSAADQRQSEPPAPQPTPAAPLELAPVPLRCEHCEQAFGSINALNAHQWRCKARSATQPAPVSANGNGTH